MLPPYRLRQLMLALVLQLDLHVLQGLATIHHLMELLPRRVVRLARGLVEDLGKPGDRIGIDRIVLCTPRSGPSKVTYPLWVDDPNFDLGGAGCLGPRALIAAACFHHHLADLVPVQPGFELTTTVFRACKHAPKRQRTNASVDLVLGDINTRDNEFILCHHPAPFLARPGSKPMQLFGLKEDTGSVPRSPSGS